MDSSTESLVDLRVEYAVETQALCRQGALAACGLAITLVPLDWVVCPERFTLFLSLRAGCVVVLGGIFVVLRTPVGRRHALGLGVSIALLVGLLIDVFTIFNGGAASPYYAGVNLVMVAVALLMPWPPRWAVLTCAILIGCYIACTFATPISDPRLFVSNLSFLLTTAIITVVSSALRDRLRWREFHHRTALAEAVRHKSEFMARMSHELRTPVHVMIGYSDILLEDALAEGGRVARELVERVRSHATLLHRMISDLLDYAKIEAGKMEVHAVPLDLRGVVAQVAEGFRPLTERKGLTLRVLCDADLPSVTTDRDKIEQVLRNLVGNAVKFTERGDVTIEARARATTALLANLVFLDDPGERQPVVPPDTIAIVVRDTGIGIRLDKVASLAADFQQVDAAAAARYGGTGLGLSISKRVVALLGGRIAVRSRYREGSTFVVLLPARTAAPSAAVPTAA
jgi:signal transduction histidine kinase